MRNPATIFSVLLLLALAGCGGGAADQVEHADHAGPAEVKKGAHNGRLLTEGAYTLELAIFEDGAPPEFQAWLYRDGKPQLLQPGDLTVVVKRLGGITDTHEFEQQGDHLRSLRQVYEPHSFDVDVSVTAEGRNLHWTYSSYEGRTTIPAAVATQAGVVVEPAGPGVIRDEHEVQGLLTTVEGRHAHVVARFAGPVRSVTAAVGDTVRAGQPIAVVESNTSLSNYTVTAPIAGTVLARDVSVGDLAASQTLFEIADLSRLWVDLHLFGFDAQHITPGLPVEIVRLSDGVKSSTKLDRVLPGTATASQSTVARATLVNSDGRWRPGAAVRARVTVAEEPVELMVPLSALQRFRDWDVVYIRVGDDYEARPIELGRRDGQHVEVTAGLRSGDPVVVQQSYLVKADIEKSGASHDH
ncbi:MAG: efflux RND transporter periplasmic adaptor subunit [Pseudomonadota bacterium]